MTSIVALSQNIALLLALIFLYGFAHPLLARFARRVIDILNGVLFGLFAIITMMQPIQIAPGAFYDGRTIIIAIAGLYVGPIPALIAAFMAGVYRLSVGGIGAYAGVGWALTAALLSILARQYLLQHGKKLPSARQLIGIGIALSLLRGVWVLLIFNFDLSLLGRMIPNTILLYPLGMLLVGSLLTSQRRSRETEAALRANERRFRGIFDSSSQHMSLLKPDGTILEVNETALRAWHLQFESVVGRRFWEIFPLMPTEARQKLQESIQRAAQGETIRYEVDDWMPDGLIFDFALTPIFDEHGQVVLIIPESHNITERKMAEMALHESERRYRALFDSAFEFIGLLKPDGKIVQVNRTVLDFYSVSMDRVAGHYIWDILLSDRSIEQMKDVVARVAQGEFIRYETEIVGVNDRHITVDFSLSPIFDEAGGVVLLLPEGHDITERKHYERQTLELALERERTGILKKFVNDISHDLRTPLSVIVLNLELLQRTKDTAQQERRVGVLIQASNHLTRLLNDMVTMLNLGDDSDRDMASKFILQSVNEVVQKVIDGQQKNLQCKRQNLVVDLAPADAVIQAADDELHRALTNLVSNAVSYTARGGTITITTRIAHDRAFIEVRDTGIGIADTDLPSIFQRFYRADQARSIDTGGTGLGLAITKKIIEAHGGTIEVESKVGDGSMFRVSLPQASQSMITSTRQLAMLK